MEFKQYSSYKNSGVEWLGEVPEHWNLKRFCYLFAENKKKNIGLKETNVLSLSYGNIKEKKIDDNKGLLPESFETYQIIEPNDIVFRFTDLQNDKRSLRSAISKYHGIITSAYIAVKTKQNADFYNYLFRAYDLQKVFYSMGEGMRQSLKMDELNKMPVVLPSEDEQKRIVAFLNTETTRIDNLITKQEKLIELLEEQRKSIISHAVTKGLNPNAPMKDSGVEWLGDVPEHWMTPSSKHLLEIPITDGPHETPNFVDDGVPFISAEAISKGKIDFDKKRGYITPELNAIYSKKYSPKIEDIYMVKSGATTGKVAMVGTTEEFNIWSPLAVFRCNKNKVLPKFLLAVFNSSHFYDALVLNWSYGTQQNIGMGVLSNIEIPCPPLKEQAEIIQHLDSQNTKFDKLISTQSQLIEKLKEYRSSIISHAVTGKIDVREFGA
ncbi:restriction endonuclease subunit S [Acinetobacter baumannii]|uniref:restriction endonuclease subunit S n=1 Tax=Acinetobacter baumannii TaxID=470 RepID=UPI0013B7FC92|nr:restriction endonuclease subunit S [Acinetobacter baumannii]NDX19258.1 restriction endonuclease subunit S [Acinetobacter baumannii]NDX37640.1 restriction endonuclease subunit S [Acinetobacter baumannii]